MGRRLYTSGGLRERKVRMELESQQVLPGVERSQLLGPQGETHLHVGDVQGTIGHQFELGVIPRQPLPVLLPLDSRLRVPGHSAWQPHRGAKCQCLICWSPEDDGRQPLRRG